MERTWGWFRHTNSKPLFLQQETHLSLKKKKSYPDNILFSRWGKVKPALLGEKQLPEIRIRQLCPVWLLWRGAIPTLAGSDCFGWRGPMSRVQMIFQIHIRSSCEGFALNCRSTKKLKSNFPLKSWGFFFLHLRLQFEVRKWDTRNSQTGMHSIWWNSILHIPVSNCAKAQMVYSLTKLRLASIRRIQLTAFSRNGGILCIKLIDTGENEARGQPLNTISWSYFGDRRRTKAHRSPVNKPMKNMFPIQ